MWPKFGNSIISMRKVIITSILQGIDQKNRYFEGWSWLKFNNLGLVLGKNLTFYSNVIKRFKTDCQKVLKKFIEEVYRRKNGRGGFLAHLHSE